MKKIGVFDSGMGGLKFLHDLQTLLPEYDYVYLGDTKHNPYGTKTGAEIKLYTFSALKYLFEKEDVGIVILACNTAAAYAARDWQAAHPDKKVLSVTIPGIEAMLAKDCSYYGVLATEATMASGVYPYLFSRFADTQSGLLEVVSAGEIVTTIESGCEDEKERECIASSYLEKFQHPIECLVLGCTHFPIWMDTFARLYTGPIIDPGLESAQTLVSYLERHKEIADHLTREGTIRFCISGDVENFVEPAQYVRGKPLDVTHVSY